jgi:hypothetical protein
MAIRSNRKSRLRLVVAGIFAVSLTLLGAPAIGDEGHDHGSAGSDELCTAKERAQLRKLGDNFVAACDLAGNDYAGLTDEPAAVAAGETASSDNVTLLANLPKQGAFATESSLNSDLAFQGDYAYAGNYNGIMVYDISEPAAPTVVAQVVCPGSQGDVSVYQDVLIMSVDSSRSDNTCNSVSQSATEKSSWEGLRIFDISNPASPQYVAAVETNCGSHTHTIAPDAAGADLYVYVSSYSPNTDYPDCQPPHDKISVVKVPLAAPASSAVVATPVLFPDGGNPGGSKYSATTGCHDLTAYPSKNVMAGACMGDGILLDISNRTSPVVTDVVQDTENFAFWHSATWNNDATKVVFTDELGGGGGATCNKKTDPVHGADAIYDIVGGKLTFRSYYKMPRLQSKTENCVAHNGSLIPVPGRDIMVQAWYQGGISVVDFTDSANPREIGWFDRGAYNDKKAIIAGAWSTYYYNGHIYSNEIQRGFDVLDISDPLTDPAKQIHMDVFNAQSQPFYN